MAALQGHMLENKGRPQAAIDSVAKLLQANKPQTVECTPVWNHLRRVGLEHWAWLLEYHG